MGLFDRFRSAKLTAGDHQHQADTAEQDDALHLIDEGNALEDKGRLEEAMQHYEAAIRLAPNLARAHLNRGNVLFAKDDIDGALAAYTSAIKHHPEYPAAHYNAGNANTRLGRHEAALNAYRETLRLKPDFTDAEVALGGALEELGQNEEAVARYAGALTRNPSHVGAAHSLERILIKTGESLLQAERLVELENWTRLLLKQNSDSGLAWKLLGVSLQRQGRDGLAAMQKAAELLPEDAELHSNLGNTLLDIGQLDLAVASYQRALEIRPDFAVAHGNLGLALKDLGQLDAAVASCRRALEIAPSCALVHSNLLFTYNFLANYSPEEALAEARYYGERVHAQAFPYTSWHNVPQPTRCLRVGLVSGDLRQHPVGNFLDNMLAALTTHTEGRLELFAYPTAVCTDTVSDRIKACCRDWYPVAGLSDENLAQRIRDDGIDILIDLSGHTAHNRLPVFAWKPAPVQASWLGYLATTGVPTMDYLIADHWTLPEPEEAHFTEKIWRLPATYLCFTPPDVEAAVSPLPALANGHITFGSFNNLAKMNDAVVALWARVLAVVPGSRLLLKAKQFAEPSIEESIAKRFATHGVDRDRLILKCLVPRTEYLIPYHEVDIALDPFPYQGITTSVEALWMGVPVLTLAGERFLSRQGVGLLMNVGLPEWIATDLDDYVARAVSHAGDLQALATLRNGLRQQVLASPIFDAPRFACHFEDALRGMWQKWCDQQHKQIVTGSATTASS